VLPPGKLKPFRTNRNVVRDPRGRSSSQQSETLTEMRPKLPIALLTLTALCAYPAERWQVQYFYDADDSSLAISDLRFATPERGMAVGAFVNLKNGKTQPAALVTEDGGRTWNAVKTPDIGVSLFFFDDGPGWMVGEKGIWRTESFGREWKKAKGAENLQAISFADREHGWAAGARDAVYETADGGKSWKRIKLPGTAAAVDYNSVAFADSSFGVIAGTAQPAPNPRIPRASELAGGLEGLLVARSEPVLMATFDGGRTWRPVLKGAGRILRMRISPSRKGLFAFESPAPRPEKPEWRLSCWVGGFADKSQDAPKAPNAPPNVMITDVHLAADGTMYLAGFEPPGRVMQKEIPGKLKVFRAPAGQQWTEVPVDYRAQALSAVLAPAGGDLWLATDTGMILKLVAQ
jgi:hypothetical protein